MPARPPTFTTFCRRLLTCALGIASLGSAPAAVQTPSSRPASRPSAIAPAPTDAAFLPVFNLRVTALPQGWTPKPRTAGVENLFVADGPQAGDTFFINAFHAGVERQRTPAQMAADYFSQRPLLGVTVLSRNDRPRALSGIAGGQASGQIRETATGIDFNYVVWFGAHGGIEYQLICVSRRPMTELLPQADALFGSFQLLEPRLRLRVADIPAAPAYQSPLYKYRFRSPPGWIPAAKYLDTYAGAETAGAIADHSIFITIPSVIVPGADPDDVARAVLKSVGLDWNRLHQRERFDAGRFLGYRLADRTEAFGITTRRHGRLWIGEGVAIFAIVVSTHPQADAIANEALSCLDVSAVIGSRDPDITRALMTDEAIFNGKRFDVLGYKKRGVVQNELGIALYEKKQFGKAADLFFLSLQYELDIQVVANWIDALTADGQADRAGKVLGLAMARYPADSRVLGAAVRFYTATADVPRLMALCEKAFPNILVDDDLFAGYVGRLFEMGQLDKAAGLIKSYQLRSDTVAVALLQAELLLEQDAGDQAIDLLTRRLKRDASVVDVGPMLARCQIRIRDFIAADRTINAYENARGDRAGVAFLRGLSALAQQEFADAKRHFEAAKSANPAFAAIDEWIRVAGASAGQGRNSDVRAPIEPVAIPADLLGAQAPPLDRSLGAAYRYATTAVHFEADKPRRITNDDVIDIYDQRGVELFNTVSRQLNPLYERIYVNRVEVRDENGNLISEGKPDDYYVLDVQSDEKATLDQTINIPVAGLRPGCSLRVQTTRELLRLEPDIGFEEFFASRSLPVGRSVIYLSGDTAGIRIAEFNGANRVRRDDGSLAWLIESPAYLAHEPFAPELSDFVPGIAVAGRGLTWDAEATDYLKLIDDRLRPVDVVAQEARKLGIADASPIEKLRAVASYVQSQYAYKAIAFGPRSYIPTEVPKIIANRYGDCKDQALLTHLLLREVGVKSHLALVRAAGTVYPDLASSKQFDHMIVHVPDCDGQAWWVDTTDRTGPGVQTTPGPSLRGRHALVLDAVTPRLVELPRWDSASTGFSIARSLAIGDDGDFAVVDRTTIRGELASMFRSAFHEVGENRRNEYAARLLCIDLSAMRTWSIQIESLDDRLGPLVIEARYAPRQKLKRTGSRFVGELPAQADQSMLLPEVIERRRLPFKQSYGLNYDVSLELTWPADWRSELDESQAQTFKTPFGESRVAFGVADGNRLTGKLSLRSTPGLHPAAQYAAFCDSRREIIDAWTIPLVFRRDVARD